MLKGNLAIDGCIVKTAGVDESILKFAGPARVFESQDAAVQAILTNKIKAGDVVVIRYDRSIHLAVSETDLASRRAKQESLGWKPAEARR